MFVRVKIKQRKDHKIYEKEVAVRPTLTAWIDSATGCFVGWVISVMPNSETISEAFCRAAVLTPGVPFRGLPKAILVDCGKDYKSRFPRFEHGDKEGACARLAYAVERIDRV